ncbi:hypothetical protein BH11BAC5_BH11BAC5_54660 [soil metagenome]
MLTIASIKESTSTLFETRDTSPQAREMILKEMGV